MTIALALQPKSGARQDKWARINSRHDMAQTHIPKVI